jgi:hypothetical protein
MDSLNDRRNFSRRDLLKLAGTAAAFCASFGFLHGEEEPGQQASQRLVKGNPIQSLKVKWERAQMKWYSEGKLLGTTDFPPAVLKVLQSDLNGSVTIKWFRADNLNQTLGKIAANR